MEDINIANKINVKSFILYSLLVLGASLITYLKEVSHGIYAIILAVVVIVGDIVLWYFFRRDSQDVRIKYVLCGAFCAMIFTVMMFGNVEFRFAICFVPMMALVLYHDTMVMSVAAGFVNILSLLNVLVCLFVLGMDDAYHFARYAIQILTLLLGGLFAVCISYYYGRFTSRTLEQNAQLRTMSIQTIETIANTLDAKDSYTQGHSRRVAEYSAHIAEEMGFNENEIKQLRYIALLHDVGKIAVPDSVLNKPSRLSRDEYNLMKNHTTAGGDILKDVETIPGISLGARYHHERFDGKGYPDGLSGEAIPLVARIICVADAFDAMTSNRVYRRQLPFSSVLEEINNGRGSQFDGKCVDAFMRYVEKVGEQRLFEDAGNVRIGPGDLPDEVDNMGTSAADIDTLTGILNRSAGEDRIKATMSRTKGALALFNVVNLNEINIEYGFKRGDYCLKTVSTVLVSMEQKDIIACRYEGNKILVFIPGADTRDVAAGWMDDFCERIHERRKGDPLLENIFWIGAGFTLHNDIGKEFSYRVKSLIKAVYNVKDIPGMPYVFWDPALKEARSIHSDKDMAELVDIILMGDRKAAGQITGQDSFLDKAEMIRKQGAVGVVLFNMSPVYGEEVTPERCTDVMAILDECLQQVMGGITRVYRLSSLQRIILVSIDEEMIAAGRAPGKIAGTENEVMSAFHKRHGKNDVELSYSHRILTAGGVEI